MRLNKNFGSFFTAIVLFAAIMFSSQDKRDNPINACQSAGGGVIRVNDFLLTNFQTVLDIANNFPASSRINLFQYQYNRENFLYA